MENLDVMPKMDGDIFDGDRQRRGHLAENVQEIVNALEILEMSDELEKAQQLKNIVLQDTFKVLVLGEFKTGKSTFINALLGAEILPSYATPTTAIINEVKWGDTKRAVLHFLEEDNKRPLEIDADDLEQYVVIQDDEQEIRESPYSFVELFWPIDLCRNNVEIIDSPGLNESKVREKVTIDYLSRVDAVLFVMSAVKLGPGIHERDTLEMLGRSGHDELFFIINQFDLLRRDRDRQAVIKRAHDQLLTYTKRKEPLYFISSLDALDGRIDKDQQRIEKSQIMPLESTLYQFLANERSRIKTKRAAIELQLTIARAQQTIPDKRVYLRMPLSELQEKYEAAREQFDHLRQNKADIVNRVDRFRRDMNLVVADKVRIFFQEMYPSVDNWIDEYPLKLKFNFDIKGQIEDAVQGMVGSLSQNLEDAFKTWSQDILMVFILDRIQGLQTDLERRAEEFEANLEKIRFDLSGASFTSEEVGLKEGPKNALERTLAAAGGFLISGFAGAGLGAVFGWREVIKSIMPQLLLAIAAGIFALPALPHIIIAVLLGFAQGGVRVHGMGKKIRTEVGKNYKQKLREIAPDEAQKVAHQLDKEIAKLQKQLELGLQVRIDEIEEQVTSALEKQKEGQDAVTTKLAEINKIEKRLSDISVKLVQFIASVEQID